MHLPAVAAGRGYKESLVPAVADQNRVVLGTAVPGIPGALQGIVGLFQFLVVGVVDVCLEVVAGGVENGG